MHSYTYHTGENAKHKSKIDLSLIIQQDFQSHVVTNSLAPKVLHYNKQRRTYRTYEEERNLGVLILNLTPDSLEYMDRILLCQ